MRLNRAAHPKLLSPALKGLSSPLKIWEASAGVFLNLHPGRNRVDGACANIGSKVVDGLLFSGVFKGYGLGVKIVGATAFL